MPTFDSTAKAALDGPGFAPGWFIWVDIDGDPIRVTNVGADVTFSGTGDADLDGETFEAFGGQFLDVGDVGNSDSGSETLPISLSGIVTLDTDLLNAIGNVIKWQGRTCRIWLRLYDVTGATPQGAVASHYTGYMSSVSIMPSPESQAIQVTIENYLAAAGQASNRNYLSQKTYDAADVSATAVISAANGSARGGVGVASTPTGPRHSGIIGGLWDRMHGLA
jgi:hypothetical protein